MPQINAQIVINNGNVQAVVQPTLPFVAISAAALNGISLLLTTTGSSGAATLIGNTLNIPVYTGGITNAAANNELMKSNSINAIASGIFSTANGSLIFQGAAPSIQYSNVGNTITYYGEVSFTASSAGGFAQNISGGFATIPNSSTVYIECTLVGIQTSATAGARGLTLKNTGAFRLNNTGTWAQIGSSTNQFTQSDEASPSAVLSVTATVVTYTLTFAPANTYHYTLYVKYWTGQ